MRRRITEKEFDKAVKAGDVGVYRNFFGRHPEWAGRRTLSIEGDTMEVRIEGVTFDIVPDGCRRVNATPGFIAVIHPA